MASAIVGALRVILSADTAEFDTAMKRVSSSANAWSKDLGSIGRQATAVGAALTKTITLPILGVGIASVKAAMDFESSFANVAKTVDGVSDKAGVLTKEGAALAQTFRDMAKEIPVTTDELNAIAALGGQMGVPISQLEEFTRHVSALGVAVDGISAEEAAAGLAQIGNIFGKGTKDIAQMSSALVHLGNSSNATEGQILEFSKRLAGAGNAVNMTEAEVMALGTAMANVGINAEAGGTAMSTMIAKMSMAVSKGGDALKAFGKVSGLGAQGFAEAWKSSPIQAIDSVVQGLSRIKAEGGDLNLVVREIGATNIRTADTMKRLAGAGDGVAKMLAISNEGYADGKKHIEEFEKKAATFANQLKVLWSNVKDVGITLGNSLLPTLKDLITVSIPLVNMVAQAAEMFSSLPTPVRLTAVAVLGLVAAVGPLLWGLGQIITAAGTVAGAFKVKGIATRALGSLMSSTSGIAIALRGALLGVGSAAAVAATGFTAWKLGTWLGEFTGLTNMVGYLSAKLGELIGLLPKGAAAQYTATVRAIEAAKAAKAQAEATDQAAAAQNDLGDAFEFVGPILDRNRNGMDDYEEATEEARKAAERFAESLRELGGQDALDGAKEVLKQLDALGGPLRVLPDKLTELEKRLRDGAEAATLLGKTDLAAHFTRTADAIRPLTGESNKWRDSIDGVNESASAMLAWLRPFPAALSDSSTEITNLAKGLDAAGYLIEGNALETAKARQEAEKWAMENGAVLAPSIRAVSTATEDAEEDTESWRASISRLSEAFAQLAQVTSGAFSEMVSWLGQVTASMNLAAQSGDTMKKGFDKMGDGAEKNFEGIVQAAAGVAAAIASVWQATSGTNQAKNMFGGFLTGAAAGSAFGPWGAAIGGIGGLLVGMFRKTNGEVARFNKEIDKVRAGLLKQFGSMERIRKLGIAVGIDLAGAWKHQGEAGLKAFQEMAAEFEEAVEKMESDLEDFRSDLDGAYNDARELGYIFDQNGDLVSVAFDRMQDAAEEFGIDINSLGPAFQNQRIQAEAKRIIDAFELLTKGGADVGSVLMGMRDEISRLVHESIRFGTELPANMQPWIHELVRAGQLLSEDRIKANELAQEIIDMAGDIPASVRAILASFIQTGDLIDSATGKTIDLKDLMALLGNDASESVRQIVQRFIEMVSALGDTQGELTDLSGLRFSDPIVTAFELIQNEIRELIAKIAELIEILTEELTPALDEATRDRRGRVGWDIDPIPNRALEFDTGTKGRTGNWFGNFGSGMAATLHGMEAVVTPQQAPAFAADVLSGLNVNNNLQPDRPIVVHSAIASEHKIVLDGFELKRWITDQITTAIENNDRGLRSRMRDGLGVVT